MTDLGTALTELLKVEENAGVALLQSSVKAQVCAKNDIDRILAKPVLPNSHLRTEPAKLVACVARLIQEALRMDVPRRLNDAEMDL